MRVFFHLAGIFVFALIAWGTWPKLVDAWVENEFFGAQGVFTAPVWPIKACLFGGSVLTCLAFATQVLKDIKEILNSTRVEPLTIRHSVTVEPRGIPFLIAFGLVLVLGYALFFADLGRIEIGFAAIGFMLLLIFSGAHIAVVLILLSFLGIWLIRDNPNVAMRSLALAADGAINRYLFGVVPLFVLMGLIVDTADIGRDAYRVAAWMLQKIKGRLGMATVAANAVFASITGISIASAAVFSRVAVPQMVANGYNNRFALGVVAGSSVLGMLIPPSLLLIIYGVLAEQSVGALFLAAIVPGAPAGACVWGRDLPDGPLPAQDGHAKRPPGRHRGGDLGHGCRQADPDHGACRHRARRHLFRVSLRRPRQARQARQLPLPWPC